MTKHLYYTLFVESGRRECVKKAKRTKINDKTEKLFWKWKAKKNRKKANETFKFVIVVAVKNEMCVPLNFPQNQTDVKWWERDGLNFVETRGKINDAGVKTSHFYTRYHHQTCFSFHSVSHNRYTIIIIIFILVLIIYNHNRIAYIEHVHMILWKKIISFVGSLLYCTSKHLVDINMSHIWWCIT